MRIRVAVVTAALGVGLVAATSPAHAKDDVVIEQSGSIVTYEDSALESADTTTVRGTVREIVVDGPSTTTGGDGYAIQAADGTFTPITVDDALPPVGGSDVVADVTTKQTDEGAEVARARFDDTSRSTAQAAAKPANHAVQVVVASASGTFPDDDTIRARLQLALDDWKTETGMDRFYISDLVRASQADLGNRGQQSLCSSPLTQADTYGVWNRAGALIPARPRRHLMVLLSGDPACVSASQGVLGVGTLGLDKLASGEYEATTVQYGDLFRSTAVHELGHNFGLDHANARTCSTCAAREYLDLYSVMGFGVPGHDVAPALDGRYRNYLGIVQSGEQSTPLLGSGRETITRHRIKPRGSASGLRAVKVVDPKTKAVFWIEYRAGSGRDTGAAYAASSSASTRPITYGKGVTITLEKSPDGTFAGVELLPRDAGAVDSGYWTPKSRYVPLSKAVRIYVQSVSATEAVVDVARVRP